MDPTALTVLALSYVLVNGRANVLVSSTKSLLMTALFVAKENDKQLKSSPIVKLITTFESILRWNPVCKMNEVDLCALESSPRCEFQDVWKKIVN